MTMYWAIAIDRETGEVTRKELYADRDEAYEQALNFEGPTRYTTVVRTK